MGCAGSNIANQSKNRSIFEKLPNNNANKNNNLNNKNKNNPSNNNNNNTKQNSLLNIITQKVSSTKKISQLNGKLENNDILERLMAKPLVAAFFQKVFALKRITSEMELEYKGLFFIIKPELDEISKRFEIGFAIPKSQFEVDLRSFKLECTPCTDSDLDLYLPLFLFEILIYPKSFLKNLKLKEFVFINSLNFHTAEYEQYRAACPEYYKTMSIYYCAQERFPNYIRTVIHHELFHYVDFIHDKTYDDPKFSKFNTPGFRYGKGGAYEREWKPLSPETKGFLNFYSTTGIEEDKAEIYQFIMSFPNQAFKHQDEVVNKKVFYIGNFLKEFDKDGMGDVENDYFASLSKHRQIYCY